MSAFPTLLQCIDCKYEGDYYIMDLNKDTFVHFTYPDRAEQILKSGKLLMNPPYDKFGTDLVSAVSTVWGEFVPGVQTTHNKKQGLVAVVFKTRTVPLYGHAVEVLWEHDVVLVRPKIVSFAKGKGMLSGKALNEECLVYYEVPDWCNLSRTSMVNKLAMQYLSINEIL